MKLTLIGGGGVRSPLFVMTLLRRQKVIGLDELCLLDIDERKLSLFGSICKELVHRAGNPCRITGTKNVRDALTGVDHVVTTIRPGFEKGRALDERIAFNHGVLGQETTGPAGFAMALRSIPAIMEYVKILQELSPSAWMHNFSNPSGLIVQGIRDAGYDHIIGICDGANSGQAAVATWAGMDNSHIHAEVFGLNHLSWCRHAWLDDKDLMPRAIKDERFLNEMQAPFEPDLVRKTGMFLNEYLYYYYYAEKAVAGMLLERKTRGEEVVEINQRLMDQLEEIGVEQNPDRALRAFFGYEKRRGATYMRHAYGGITIEEADREQIFDSDIPAEAGEGYAGVALSIIEAMITGKPLYTALNVPNKGSIIGMADSDVVEVSCKVDRDGVHVLPIGEIPAPQLGLMRSVKLYENLTVQANKERSRALAVQALMAHPLVLSYSRAEPLVNEYLDKHKDYVGEWQ